MIIPEPKCKHKTPVGSVLVSSHKDIRKAKGKMASVRVCHRQACIDDAVRWVRAMGPGRVWVAGERHE